MVDGSTFLGKFGFWDACAHIDTSVSSSSSSSSPPPHEHGSTSRIKQELRAQLDWFVEHVGHNPTHVDGHNHIHVIPQVVQAMAEVLPTYNITWVRMPCEDLSDYQWPSAKSQMFYDRVVGEAERAKAVFTEAGIGYSDHFIGLRLMGKAASLLALENVLDSINTTNASNVDERSHDEKSATAIQGNGAESCEADRSTEKKGEAPSAPSSSSSSPSLSPSSSPSPRVQSVEYMCHPGYASEKGDDFSRSKDREHELALLTSTRAHACIIERNIALSSFADL